MESNAVRRELHFVAWIKAQRGIHRELVQRALIEPVVESMPVAAGTGSGGEQLQREGKKDWASGVPDGPIVGAAVLGACIGCPIGVAVDGALGGFLAGFIGALLGEVTVLGVAKLMKLALRAWRWAH
ncbi:MAG TPA: hypothetical protein VHE33_09960 [Acidobacteriaceae bacterium]|nr:hypothetical protein [Acidobacteriaceae bacterium]